MRLFVSFFVCLCPTLVLSQCASDEDHLELKFFGDSGTPVFNFSATLTKVDTVRSEFALITFTKKLHIVVLYRL